MTVRRRLPTPVVVDVVEGEDEVGADVAPGVVEVVAEDREVPPVPWWPPFLSFLPHSLFILMISKLSYQTQNTSITDQITHCSTSSLIPCVSQF